MIPENLDSRRFTGSLGWSLTCEEAQALLGAPDIHIPAIEDSAEPEFGPD